MATHRLRHAFSSRRLALTAECVPPLAASAEALARIDESLPTSLDAILVSDHHAPAGSAFACAALLAARGRDPVLPLNTRDKNRIALESEAIGAAALGIKTLLCLSGAHQTLGVSPKAASVHDVDSIQLVQALDRMVSDGIDFAGNRLESAPDVLVAAVAHPYLRPLGLSLLELRKKIAAGARVLWTDPIFDLRRFEQWMEAVRGAGLDKKAAIIVSMQLLTSAAEARELRSRPGAGTGIGEGVVVRLEEAHNPAEAGLALFVEIAQQLKATPGVRGIHVLNGGNHRLVSQAIAAARLG